eukprot:UN22238
MIFWKILTSAFLSFSSILSNFDQYSGPRHTPNPSPLRNFCVQKITDKKFMIFSEKLRQHFKSTIQLVPKLLRTHCSLKIRPDFEVKEFENFVFSKKCIFCTFSQILKFYF